MNKKKKKGKPFDNSITETLEPPLCPKCDNKDVFLYRRKRTKDEVWFCTLCEVPLQIIITTDIKIKRGDFLDE